MAPDLKLFTRYVCLARKMIYIAKSILREDDLRKNDNLIVDVGDVHHEMDIVTEVVRHNPTKNVLCDIVSGIGRIRDLAASETHREHTLRGPYEQRRRQ